MDKSIFDYIAEKFKRWYETNRFTSSEDRASVKKPLLYINDELCPSYTPFARIIFRTKRPINAYGKVFL